MLSPVERSLERLNKFIKGKEKLPAIIIRNEAILLITRIYGDDFPKLLEDLHNHRQIIKTLTNRRKSDDRK